MCATDLTCKTEFLQFNPQKAYANDFVQLRACSNKLRYCARMNSSSRVYEIGFAGFQILSFQMRDLGSMYNKSKTTCGK